MDLIKALGYDSNPKAHLARNLTRDHHEMVKALVKIRKDNGLSLRKVAEDMGTDASAVHRFETGQTDFRLSTLRRYAIAIGANIHTTVTPLENTPNYTSVKTVWGGTPIKSIGTR
ncbi:helix-turn-helix domain-containing protein [Trueperella sp. LYQ143]|uniref:helix-turn-helix domain-containing protein n=1 Tax=Trueperella sp. LYQ143 TaxID=3391059 RepID=UPI003982ECF3